MKKLFSVIAIVNLVLILVVGYVVFKPTSLGGAKPVVIQQNFSKGFIDGGLLTAIAETSTSTATYTLTASQICNSNLITFNFATNTIVTAPTYAQLQAGCLSDKASSKTVRVLNVGTSSTIFAAGTGGTLLNSSATSVATNKAGLVDFYTSSDSAYQMGLINLPN